MFKKVMNGGIACVLAFMLVLSACGNTADDADEPELEAEVTEEAETLSLIGTWQSKENENGTYFEAVISDDDEISVYEFVNDDCYLYWCGTFTSDMSADVRVNVTSNRIDVPDNTETEADEDNSVTDIDAEDEINSEIETEIEDDSESGPEDEDIDTIAICKDDVKYFVCHNDDETIYFSYESEDDVSIGVYMSRISDDYVTGYELSVMSNDEQSDDIDTDDEDVLTNETNTDANAQEIAVQDTEAAQEDIPNIIITDDSADNVTAENDADKEEVPDESEASASTESTSTNAGGYTYTDKDITMYASVGLNVRSGPSVNFGVIGSYEPGDTVKVTGTCNETGWSRVNIDGMTGYVDTQYLTSTAPAKQSTANNTNTSTSTNTNNNTANTNTSTSNQETSESYISGGFPLYNYSVCNGQYLGRARIPSVGVNVALYNSMAQSVCDGWDSACFAYAYDIPSYGNYTINFADHSNQGFNAIKNCTIGCALYIDGIDGHTYKYVCDRIDYNGHNDLTYLYDSNWNRLDKTGGIWAYTCNENWQNVTIAHFSAV